VHVLDQTRADFHAEGKTYIATPGELLVERMVKELKRPAAPPAAASTTTPKARKSACGPSSKSCSRSPASPGTCRT
jgi:3-hydroxyacyl-CoA dehydrogenase/enoyl-CoA hydratase/3-hydroxybutyryl-CoA epimerase